MKIKVSKGERGFQVFNYMILSLLIIICIYPIWYVVMASVSDSNSLMKHSGLLLRPLDFTVNAYKKVFNNPMIIKGYANTLFILVVGLIFDMIMTSLGAYFLSRKNVLFKKPIMMFIVFTMFFEGGIIPFYLNLKDLHLTNSLWGLIIPFMIQTRNMIILRTSFSSIPESLVEAARIDGAGHITVLTKIILPLSKAMLAVIVLYYGVHIWNSWFWASAIIRDRSLYPLQVILREILLQNDMSTMAIGGDTGSQDAISQSIRYATIVVATVPILCVYPFLQRHFTKGTMVGAVKE
ncbi:ABC transporter permease subunit [Clostridium sp. MCC353]|uniref:carbohydrate ABC transporter permease n=1 Tax=Clostridium sp. MCC353 TaxID=2592646 RepID=UPI001C036577|nr:carbohydrate ABC transporter permease [Clostridium sp. MCC353]MBT9777473.1 ABC transporter permease subunit [Clostridium sp. MCC353]